MYKYMRHFSILYRLYAISHTIFQNNWNNHPLKSIKWQKLLFSPGHFIIPWKKLQFCSGVSGCSKFAYEVNFYGWFKSNEPIPQKWVNLFLMWLLSIDLFCSTTHFNNLITAHYRSILTLLVYYNTTWNKSLTLFLIVDIDEERYM